MHAPGRTIVIDDHRIVDDRGTIDDRHIPGFIHIIAADLGTTDILVRNKAPIVWRRGIAAAIGHAKADPRLHRSPAIILVTVPPGHPGRRPLIARYPHPAIAIGKEPAAIVEGSPAPGIVRSPGPAIFRIYPMTIGGIGLEIRTDIR